MESKQATTPVHKNPKYRWDDNSYNPYYNKNAFKAEDLIQGFPNYDLDDLKGDDNALDYAYYFRYIFNIALVALPYFIIGGSGVAYNIWFNVDWNKLWAEGNWWLVSNTAYMIFMFLYGLAEVLELPLMMHSFHVTRMVVFNFGMFYNLCYFLSIFEWYDMLYLI